MERAVPAYLPVRHMNTLFRLIPALLLAASIPAQTADHAEFFEKEVRPLLVAKCQMCHSAQLQSSGLDLSGPEGFMKGGGGGPLIDHDNLADSFLLKTISYEGALKMPPTGKLTDSEIATLTQWVQSGAYWPGAENVVDLSAAAQQQGFTAEQKQFWAFQPVGDPAPPQVDDAAWAANDVDRFILAKLEEAGVKPNDPASKQTLLRRAYFDLTGLPPTPADIEAFLADESPRAFENVVDKLLASPRYGERWGRHWLDVARYADSTGNDEDHRYPYAWRYRDYVIQAFNDDMPYDRFVREQVAGDLMPAPDGSAVYRQGVVATGLLALGPKAVAQQDKTRMLYDVYDEQVDVVSKAFLGLTLSCARCHDHKFDPLLTRDYYSMINFFANTRSFRDPSTHVSKLLFVPLVEEEKWAEYEAEQEEIRKRKFEIENVPEIEIEQHVAPFTGQVAAYMLAAREVYEDGKTAQAVAAAQGLDAAMVERWAAYLEPGAEVRAHMAAWDAATPAERAAVAAQFAAAFKTTADDWVDKLQKWRKQANRPAEEITMGIPGKPRFTPGENRFFHEVYIAKGGPLSFRSKQERAAILSQETQQTIAALEKELESLEADAMPEPDRACAVTEVEPAEAIQQHVFLRGDYSSKGEDAPRVFPAIIAGFDQEPVAGRLELAEWLTQPDNPLTARVIVNRVWHWHFGEGIVRTPSNFGKMGERPTHPELLDYLARRFVEDGWSIKKLHKRIMLSSAYRMSSEMAPATSLEDPENRLLSRFNRRRLDVEEIRDGLLRVDGSIDLKMGGTLMSGFGTDGENSNNRLSVNPDEQQLRTVYLPLRRSNLPALLNLFDFGDAVTPMGKRSETNVAPQALFMMNSEFVAERARNLATQLLELDADQDRVRRAYLHTLNRAPNPDEIDVGLTYVSSVENKFGSAKQLDVWESLCRILMASNEFIYVD